MSTSFQSCKISKLAAVSRYFDVSSSQLNAEKYNLLYARWNICYKFNSPYNPEKMNYNTEVKFENVAIHEIEPS